MFSRDEEAQGDANLGHRIVAQFSRASLSSTFSSSEMMMVAFFLALLNDQYDNCGKEGGVITGWDVFFYVVVFVLIGKR